MLSQGMRIAYGVIASLQLGTGIGLTVVLKMYLDIVEGSADSASLINTLTFLPIGVFWGMVVPFYVTGLLGILAAIVGKVPACAVYLTFCILALLAGISYGAFSIMMAAAAYGSDVIDCHWSLSAAGAGLLTGCDGSEISTLGSALAGLHAAGWFITLVGSIMGCVGTCCSQPDNPIQQQPVYTTAGGAVVVQQSQAGFMAQPGYAQPGYPQPGYPQPGYHPQQAFPMQQQGNSQVPAYVPGGASFDNDAFAKH